MDNIFEDIFRKLARANRVRKSCRIQCTNARSPLKSWIRIPFFQDLLRLSAFKFVNLDLECRATEFEDYGVVDRGPVTLPYGYADEHDYIGTSLHMKNVSIIENHVEELKTYLEVELGACRYYYRKNYRCLEFWPQSTRV